MKKRAMNTDLYTNKADKGKVVRYWSDFPDGGDAISRNSSNVYESGVYKYGAAKNWNIASESARDLKFEVLTP